MTMTINADKEIEKDFREMVEKEKGIGKGKLGEAINEALRKWTAERQQKEIAERMKKMGEKGMYKLPKGWKFNREEAYER